MAVTKKEFADRMAENGGITKKAAYKAVDAFIETIMDYMGENKKVMFVGFGRFEMRTFKEKKCRNPQGGADCIIPEHKRMRFYASELLTDRIEEMKKED